MEAIDMLERKVSFMEFYGENLHTTEVEMLERIKKNCLFGLVVDIDKYLNGCKYISNSSLEWDRFAKMCKEVNYLSRKNWLIYYTFMNNDEVMEEKNKELQLYQELKDFIQNSPRTPIPSNYYLNNSGKVDIRKLIYTKGDPIITKDEIDFDEVFANLKKYLNNMVSPSRSFANHANYEYCMDLLDSRITMLKYMTPDEYKNLKIGAIRLSKEEREMMLEDINKNPNQLVDENTLSGGKTVKDLVSSIEENIVDSSVKIRPYLIDNEIMSTLHGSGRQDRSHDIEVIGHISSK